MRLGIFGGTFDPPHVGHLVVAQEIHWRLRLDRLIWIPASVPPHKTDREITPGQLRLRMVRAAIGGDARFQADDMELRREGPSYTVDTVRELRRRHPESELFLVLGADQLAEFGTWREPGEIRRVARLVAFERAGEWPAGADGAAGSVERVEVLRIDVSSTEVRRRAAVGEPIRFLVPEGVLRILEDERPYAGRGAG